MTRGCHIYGWFLGIPTLESSVCDVNHPIEAVRASALASFGSGARGWKSFSDPGNSRRSTRDNARTRSMRRVRYGEGFPYSRTTRVVFEGDIKVEWVHRDMVHGRCNECFVSSYLSPSLSEFSAVFKTISVFWQHVFPSSFISSRKSISALPLYLTQPCTVHDAKKKCCWFPHHTQGPTHNSKSEISLLLDKNECFAPSN